MEKKECRKVAVGIGSHIHVEMVTKEITFPVGIPSPVAVGLRVTPFAVTAAAAFFQTVTESLFVLLCSGTDRSAVTGKRKICRVNQSMFYGLAEELLVVQFKNKPEGIYRFEFSAFQ